MLLFLWFYIIKLNIFLTFYATLMTIEPVKKINFFSVIFCKLNPCVISVRLIGTAAAQWVSHCYRRMFCVTTQYCLYLAWFFSFSPNQYEFTVFLYNMKYLSLPWAAFNLRFLNQLHCTCKGIYENKSSAFCLSSVYISTVLCVCKVFIVQTLYELALFRW